MLSLTSMSWLGKNEDWEKKCWAGWPTDGKMQLVADTKEVLQNKREKNRRRKSMFFSICGLFVAL